MATGPGDGLEAAGRGHLRASHADREQVVGTLKTAFVQGRLTKDELDLRVGQASASRTYAELAAVTADLPAGLAASQPPQPAPVPRRRPIWRRPGVMATMATAVYAGTWPVAFVLPTTPERGPQDGLNLVGTATMVYLLVLIVVCVLAQGSESPREKRSGEQFPGRPALGAGGQANPAPVVSRSGQAASPS